MKRGFFRLWVVVAVLWVGLVSWSWSDTFAGAWREGCFHDDGVSWAPAAPRTPPKPGDAPLPGDPNDWEDATPCILHGDWPHVIIPIALAHAASLPGGLLAIWFVGAWIGRGFRAPTGRTIKRQ